MLRYSTSPAAGEETLTLKASGPGVHASFSCSVPSAGPAITRVIHIWDTTKQGPLPKDASISETLTKGLIPNKCYYVAVEGGGYFAFVACEKTILALDGNSGDLYIADPAKPAPGQFCYMRPL